MPFIHILHTPLGNETFLYGKCTLISKNLLHPFSVMFLNWQRKTGKVQTVMYE